MTTTLRSRPRVGIVATLGRFARLVKYQFVLDFLLALVVVWTALAPSARTDRVTLLAILFFALGQIGVLFAVMTLDDVTGLEDGSDTANYLAADRTQLRPIKRKPLLTGELTVRQAQWYGYCSLAWGALWWAVVVLYRDHEPWWSVLGAILLLTISVQYSWGLKLSYRGLGELVLLSSAAGFVLVPYALVAGDLPVLVLAEGILFGFGQLLIAGYSNTHDINGDAAVGRRTVAVLTSPRGNRIFLGLLTASNLAVIALPILVGGAPAWFAVALLPVVVLRLRQYGSFLRNGDPLLARSRGVIVFRVTVACVLVFNAIHFGW